MDRFASNKRGILLVSFVVWLTYLGGSAKLFCYPPTLEKNNGESLNLPGIGDGRNWSRLAEELASIGVVTLSGDVGSYQVVLTTHTFAVVASVVKYLMRVLKKGLVAAAIAKIDKSL